MRALFSKGTALSSALIMVVSGCDSITRHHATAAPQQLTKGRFARVPNHCPPPGIEDALTTIAGTLYVSPQEAGKLLSGNRREQEQSSPVSDGGNSCLVKFHAKGRGSGMADGLAQLDVSFLYQIPSESVDHAIDTFQRIYAPDGEVLESRSLGDEARIMRFGKPSSPEHDCAPEWDVSMRMSNLIMRVTVAEQKYASDPDSDNNSDGSPKHGSKLSCGDANNISTVRQNAVELAKAILRDVEADPNLRAK